MRSVVVCDTYYCWVMTQKIVLLGNHLLKEEYINRELGPPMTDRPNMGLRIYSTNQNFLVWDFYTNFHLSNGHFYFLGADFCIIFVQDHLELINYLEKIKSFGVKKCVIVSPAEIPFSYPPSVKISTIISKNEMYHPL